MPRCGQAWCLTKVQVVDALHRRFFLPFQPTANRLEMVLPVLKQPFYDR